MTKEDERIIGIIGVEEMFLVRIQSVPSEIFQEAHFAWVPDDPDDPGDKTLRIVWGKVRRPEDRTT